MSVRRIRRVGATKRPKKKIVIKSFKVAPTIPEDYEETSWAVLSRAVRAVHEQTRVDTALEELYQLVENLCTYKMAGQLYTRLETQCREHIVGVGESLRAAGEDGALLSRLDEAWGQHVEQVKFIRQVFLVIDRSYVIQTPGKASLWEMGLRLFRDHVLLVDDIVVRVVEGLLRMIESERCGNMCDTGLVDRLIRMLSALQVYQSHFLTPFVQGSERFYASEGEARVASSTLSEYLHHVSSRLDEETARLQTYLDAASTTRPLVDAVEQHLIVAHLDFMLGDAFATLVAESRLADLGRLFAHVSRVNALSELHTAFVAVLTDKGKTIVMDKEKEKVMVARLIEFKRASDGVITGAFDGHRDMVRAQKEAFESFMNAVENRPAELIAKFMDKKLKASSQRTSSEEETINALEEALEIFGYILGKDVFEGFYKLHLSKRLLLQKSASFDAEKAIILRLKKECGTSFTNKLEGMFKDIDVSADLSQAFAEHLESGEGAGLASGTDIEFNVHVLTMGFWPHYNVCQMALPTHMAQITTAFEAFYTAKHSGRQLQWQHSLESCVVRARFPQGEKQLLVSLMQTVVLLLFNAAESMTYEDIKTATDLSERDLKRTLLSLACAKSKTRVLVKKPKGRQVNPGDVFSFNKKFKNPQFRVKINQIQARESKEDTEKTKKQVVRGRQQAIDAAIVRIMKARKTLPHAQLLQECAAELRFPLKAIDIKKRIEILIDREYIRRDQENSSQYSYVA